MVIRVKKQRRGLSILNHFQKKLKDSFFKVLKRYSKNEVNYLKGIFFFKAMGIRHFWH